MTALPDDDLTAPWNSACMHAFFLACNAMHGAGAADMHKIPSAVFPLQICCDVLTNQPCLAGRLHKAAGRLAALSQRRRAVRQQVALRRMLAESHRRLSWCTAEAQDRGVPAQCNPQSHRKVNDVAHLPSATSVTCGSAWSPSRKHVQRQRQSEFSQHAHLMESFAGDCPSSWPRRSWSYPLAAACRRAGALPVLGT